MVELAVRLPTSDAYLQRLGLSSHPFPLAPDASRYFLTEALEVLAFELLFCIQQRKGFMVVTGEVGLGKTTLSRYLIGQLPANTAVAVVLNSLLQGDDLLHQICLDFGLIEAHDEVRGRAMVNRLNAFFLAQRQAGRNCVIFIDDAQNLSTESLELVRVLSNLETDREKLVQVVLIGQQELMQHLNQPQLRQLASRLALSRELGPLSDEDMRRYIDYKLAVSATGSVIQVSAEAHAQIAAYAQGNLRRLNKLLDRALIALLGQQRRHIDGHIIDQALTDLDPVAARASHGAPSHTVAAIAVGVLMLGLALGAAWIAYTDWTPPPPRLSGPAPAPIETITAVPIEAPVETAIEALVIATAVTQPEPARRADQAALDSVIAQLAPNSDPAEWQMALQSNDLTRLRASVLDGAGVRALRDRGSLGLQAEDPSWGDWLHGLTPVSGDERWWLWRPQFTLDGLDWFSQGGDVRQLQARLQSAGFDVGEIDGIAGSQTFTALLAFQRRERLPATGQVDDLTLLWLHRFEPLADAQADTASGERADVE